MADQQECSVARPSCDGCHDGQSPHDQGCPATPEGCAEEWFLAKYHLAYLAECLKACVQPDFWQPHVGQRAQARADAERLIAHLRRQFLIEPKPNIRHGEATPS